MEGLIHSCDDRSKKELLNKEYLIIALDEIDLIDESFYKDVKDLIKSDDPYIIATVFYGFGKLYRRE